MDKFKSVLAIVAVASTFFGGVNSAEVIEYGVDVSFSHQHAISTNYPWLPHNIDPESKPTIPDEHVNKAIQFLGDRKGVYDEYIQGCRDHWLEVDQNACDSSEQGRFQTNINQPMSMVNYTETGYKKIKAPEHVFKMITDFWDANKDKESMENFEKGNSYINYWKNPSTIVSVENTDLIGGGEHLYDSILNVTRDLISEWTGQELEGSSVYGIRIYKEGAILAPHVDRLPLISSAIINVAQDVEEAWPLEVIGHDGKAKNVTMEPGEMVLYESHSVIHSRPFALKGRYFANIFIHFMPIPTKEQLFDHALPPYIQEGSLKADAWYSGEYDNQIPGAPRKEKKKPAIMEPKYDVLNENSASHMAAATGDLEELMRIAKEEKEALFFKDEAGWEPIHEAVRIGSRDTIEFLIGQGADLNAVTFFGSGDYPLDLAIEDDHDNDFIEWLRSLGAKTKSDELYDEEFDELYDEKYEGQLYDEL